MIDMIIRRTDHNCQLSYLPQATEEDHGAHPFKGTGSVMGALTFAAVVAPFLSAIRRQKAA
jgi:hypothetical protein